MRPKENIISRVEISGEVYDFAVGVDHITGVFLQVWKKPADDQDGCFLKVEGKNLVADTNSDEFKSLPKPALNYINDCVARMQQGQGDYLSEAHIYNILSAMDSFPDPTAVRAKIYRALD